MTSPYLYVLTMNEAELEDQRIFLTKDQAIKSLTRIFHSMTYLSFQTQYIHIERFRLTENGYIIDHSGFTLDREGEITLFDDRDPT